MTTMLYKAAISIALGVLSALALIWIFNAASRVPADLLFVALAALLSAGYAAAGSYWAERELATLRDRVALMSGVQQHANSRITTIEWHVFIPPPPRCRDKPLVVVTNDPPTP